MKRAPAHITTNGPPAVQLAPVYLMQWVRARIMPVADPENKAGGFTTTVRKSLHVTSIRGRVREGDVPPPARSAEAQRCSTICGRYLIEKSARQSTFNLA